MGDSPFYLGGGSQGPDGLYHVQCLLDMASDCVQCVQTVTFLPAGGRLLHVLGADGGFDGGQLGDQFGGGGAGGGGHGGSPLGFWPVAASCLADVVDYRGFRGMRQQGKRFILYASVRP